MIFQNATAMTQPLTVVGACFWDQGLPGLAVLYWQPWSCHISLGAPFTIPGLLAHQSTSSVSTVGVMTAPPHRAASILSPGNGVAHSPLGNGPPGWVRQASSPQ